MVAEATHKRVRALDSDVQAVVEASRWHEVDLDVARHEPPDGLHVVHAELQHAVAVVQHCVGARRVVALQVAH